MTKQPLENGQRVWLEITSMYFRDSNNERKIHEYEVVETNKSSAYVVAVDRLEKYKEDTKRHSYLKHRIEQRTHNVKGNGLGDHYILWLSIEKFEQNIKYNKELRETRKKAQELVNNLSLKELKNFIKEFNGK